MIGAILTLLLLSGYATRGSCQTPSRGSPRQSPTSPIAVAPDRSGIIPPAGDPEVFVIFLRSQSHLLEEIQKIRAEDPKKAEGMEDQAAALLKISPADYVKLEPAYRKL